MAGTLRQRGGGLPPPDGVNRAAGGAWAEAEDAGIPAQSGGRAVHRWRGFFRYFAGGAVCGPRAAGLLISPRMPRALMAAALSLPSAPSMRPTLACASA